MLGSLERFLFVNFRSMPPTIRVVTYLFLLLVFGYLLLVPRFINGQLVIESKTGGTKPYRGGELALQVDGRVFKFRANEDGYWSVPVVSLLPHTVHLQVYVVDADEWYPVAFPWTAILTHDAFRLAVTPNPPAVKVFASGGRTSHPLRHIGVALAHGLLPAASAGELKAPAGAGWVPTDAAAMTRVRRDVVQIVAAVTARDPSQVALSMPLTGEGAPTYVQRIDIIDQLERRFSLRIPDEHWNYLNTVAELVDYVQKRIAYRSSGTVQSQRPTFKR